MPAVRYRPEVLEKRRLSPDDLDRLVVVTPRRAWAVLLALAAVVLLALVWATVARAPSTVGGEGILLGHSGVISVPYLGPEAVVAALHVAPGDDVDEGAPLALLRDGAGAAHEVHAPVAGTVVAVDPALGKVLGAGATVASLLPADDEAIAIVFIPTATGKLVQPGMEARLSPASASKGQYGSILGQVEEVGLLPVTADHVIALLQNAILAESLLQFGSALEVHIDLEHDPASPSGYRWTIGDGPPFAITPGTPVDVDIIISRTQPIRFLLPEGS